MSSVKSKVASKTSTQTAVLVAVVAALMFGLAAIGYGYGYSTFNIKKSASVKGVIKFIQPASKITGCASTDQLAANYTMGCCDVNAPIIGGYCKKSGCAEKDQSADSFAGKCCIGLENVGGICKQTCADFWEMASSTENPSGKCCADLVVDKKGKCVAP